MTWRMSARLLAVFALGCADPILLAQTPVFRSGADAVTIPVSVRQGNRPIMGLTAADFDLRDNGVLQQISAFSVEKVPLDLTLLLDSSTSVDGAVLERLKEAVRAASSALRTTDRVRLVVVSQVLREIVPLRSPPRDVPLAGLGADGATALYDGLAAAMMRSTPPARRQLVIAFTDGRDSASIVDEHTLADLAHRSDAVVYLIVPVARSGGPPPLLNSLVRPTSGQVVTFSESQSIARLFRRVLDEFRASYVLQYVSQGSPAEGWHDVTISVRKSGRYTITWRRGYQAQGRIQGTEDIR